MTEIVKVVAEKAIEAFGKIPKEHAAIGGIVVMVGAAVFAIRDIVAPR